MRTANAVAVGMVTSIITKKVRGAVADIITRRKDAGAAVTDITIIMRKVRDAAAAITTMTMTEHAVVEAKTQKSDFR